MSSVTIVVNELRLKVSTDSLPASGLSLIASLLPLVLTGPYVCGVHRPVARPCFPKSMLDLQIKLS